VLDRDKAAVNYVHRARHICTHELNINKAENKTRLMVSDMCFTPLLLQFDGTISFSENIMTGSQETLLKFTDEHHVSRRTESSDEGALNNFLFSRRSLKPSCCWARQQVADQYEPAG
jgi:hypothetical protein